MKTWERIISSCICLILYVLLMQQAIENQYGKDAAIAQGAGLTFLPLLFAPVLFAAFRYRMPRWRFYTICTLILLASTSASFFVLVAYVLSLWPVSATKSTIRQVKPEDIPERYYNIAAEEIKNNTAMPDIMAKAFALSGGDKEKAVSIYIKTRAECVFREAELEAENKRLSSDKTEEIYACKERVEFARNCVILSVIFLILLSAGDAGYYKTRVGAYVVYLVDSRVAPGSLFWRDILCIIIPKISLLLPFALMYVGAQIRLWVLLKRT